MSLVESSLTNCSTFAPVQILSGIDVRRKRHKIKATQSLRLTVCVAAYATLKFLERNIEMIQSVMHIGYQETGAEMAVHCVTLYLMVLGHIVCTRATVRYLQL
jgi:hypothetical protein